MATRRAEEMADRVRALKDVPPVPLPVGCLAGGQSG